MSLLNVDLRQIQPQTALTPVPDGWYKVIIRKSNLKETAKKDGGYLELQNEIIEGPHTGRIIYWNLNLFNNSQQAVDIAYKQLSAIGHCLGIYNVQDQNVPDAFVPMLHNSPYFIWVITPTGSNLSNVKGCKDINGNDPGKQGQGGGMAQPGGMPAGVPQGAPGGGQAGWVAPGGQGGTAAPGYAGPGGGAPGGFTAPGGAPYGAPAAPVNPGAQPWQQGGAPQGGGAPAGAPGGNWQQGPAPGGPAPGGPAPGGWQQGGAPAPGGAPPAGQAWQAGTNTPPQGYGAPAGGQPGGPAPGGATWQGGAPTNAAPQQGNPAGQWQQGAPSAASPWQR